MTPETKKTLIYGGVISFAVGAGLYIFTRYSAGGSGNGGGNSAQAAAAQAEADAATQEAQIAEISALSGGGGGSLSAPVLAETPQDNFAQEIAGVLQAAGLAAPQTSTTTAAPAQSSPSSTQQQPLGGSKPGIPTGPANGPKAIGPERVPGAWGVAPAAVTVN